MNRNAGHVGALGVPLHDLAGRILDLPVWRMLGAAGGGSIPIYSGAICHDDLDPEGRDPGVAAVLAACAQDGEARPASRLQDPPGPFGKWRADRRARRRGTRTAASPSTAAARATSRCAT